MRLHHHAIVVRDMDVAIHTFCDLLGQRLVLRHSGEGEIIEVAFVEDTQTGHRIELIAKPNDIAVGIDHVAFEVEDVDSEFDRLQDNGLVSEDAPRDVPEGTFMFKKVHSRSCRLAHLRDINNVKIQLVRYD